MLFSLMAGATGFATCGL